MDPSEPTARPLAGHQRDWEKLTEVDPLWAILSVEEKRGNQWNTEEFFGTGEADVARIMLEVERLRYPARRQRALDFGCGVGRLTRALSSRFETCVGVDISRGMVERAKQLNGAYANCEFVHNPHDHLRLFADASFDLIFTHLVLQHQPSAEVVLEYIAEFLRCLGPGGILVFGLPCHISWIYRVGIKRRAYKLLRGLGMSDAYLHERLGLTTISMLCIAEKKVRAFLAQQGAEALSVSIEAEGPNRRATYFVAKR